MFPLFTSWPLLITIVFCFHHSKINYLYIGCKLLDSINDLDFLSYFTDLQNSTVNSSLRHFPWFLEYHPLLAFMPSASCAAASLFYSFILLLFSSIFLYFLQLLLIYPQCFLMKNFQLEKSWKKCAVNANIPIIFSLTILSPPYRGHSQSTLSLLVNQLILLIKIWRPTMYCALFKVIAVKQ